MAAARLIAWAFAGWRALMDGRLNDSAAGGVPVELRVPVGHDASMTLDELAAATSRAIAERWWQPLTAAQAEFDITTPSQQAMFLAQVGHESGSFRYTREIWGPTPAQKRYEGRADLGNLTPGDGAKFRGRGLIQITGRNNYLQVAKALGVDLINNPALLEGDELAARSAAWFWRSRRLNAYADNNDIEGATRVINGGFNGLEDRRRRWAVARAALNC